jgi:urease accessory protein
MSVAAPDQPACIRTLPNAAPGSGALSVALVASKSVVTRAYARSPLRLLMPRNHGRAAWVFTSTYGGGLVDGDAITIDAHVAEGATLLLATQAATKVYRSPAGTSVELDARVDDDGLLVVAPDPVICFAGATYRQHQRIDLEGRAGLVYVDWFSSGRHASGERWQFDRFANRLTVRRDGRLAVLDALTLDGRDGDIARRMGRFDVVLVAAIVGSALEAEAAALFSRVSRAAVGTRADLLVGASEVGAGGCILRVAGRSVDDVGRAAREHLAFVPALLGDDPWSRKW